MPAQRKYPDALRERAVKMVFGSGPGRARATFPGHTHHALVRGIRPALDTGLLGSSFSTCRATARTFRASLERAGSGGQRPSTGARQGGWRGGGSKPAAEVRDPARGAACPDLLPPPRCLAISTVAPAGSPRWGQTPAL